VTTPTPKGDVLLFPHGKETVAPVPKRRDKLVIMAEIIDIAQKDASKTHIMFKANLSFNQLNQYLSVLSQSGLLEKFAYNSREFYKATSKGVEFMEKQCQIINLLNEGVHAHRSKVKTSLLDYNALPRSKLFGDKSAQNINF
jgi:predicted transcriptional regulator